MKKHNSVIICSVILSCLILFGLVFWLDSRGHTTLGGAIFVTSCAIATWLMTIKGLRKGELRLGNTLGTTFERRKQPVRFFLTLIFYLIGNLLFTAFACYMWWISMIE